MTKWRDLFGVSYAPENYSHGMAVITYLLLVVYFVFDLECQRNVNLFKVSRQGYP